MKKYLIILSFLLVCASCDNGSNAPVYSGRLIGSLANSVFTSDEGLKACIKSAPEDFPENSDRILLSCNYYKRKDDTFDADVVDFIEPRCKDAIRRTLSEGEDLGNDAVLIERGWISGGYANLYTQLVFKRDSETMHVLNLVYEDTSGTPSDTLRFTLHHDALGEALALDEDGNLLEDRVAGIGIMSFRIDQFLPEGVDQMPVKITGSWYRNDETGRPTLDTYPSSRIGLLKRR